MHIKDTFTFQDLTTIRLLLTLRLHNQESTFEYLPDEPIKHELAKEIEYLTSLEQKLNTLLSSIYIDETIASTKQFYASNPHLTFPSVS